MIVDIVTPVRKLVEGAKVDAVKLPSAAGQLTILPGHADLLTLLGTGEMSFSQDGRERKFAVSYGFVEVRRDKVLILAETTEESQEIDRGRASEAEKKARGALQGVLDESKFRKYQLKLQRAIVRQKVSG